MFVLEQGTMRPRGLTCLSLSKAQCGLDASRVCVGARYIEASHVCPGARYNEASHVCPGARYNATSYVILEQGTKRPRMFVTEQGTMRPRMPGLLPGVLCWSDFNHPDPFGFTVSSFSTPLPD